MYLLFPIQTRLLPLDRTENTAEVDEQGKKKSHNDDQGEEEEPPKSSTGKGILNALTKGFKRKQEDRSPEAAAAPSKSSRYPSVSGSPFSYFLLLTSP